MWTCQSCNRVFNKEKQPHSCRRVELSQHFINKDKAKEMFSQLVSSIEKEIGKCDIISLPCCIHLYGKYDFLAALPKKDRLEIRFSINRKLNSPRIIQGVPVSNKYVKNCLDIKDVEEINEELIKWIKEAYFQKE